MVQVGVIQVSDRKKRAIAVEGKREIKMLRIFKYNQIKLNKNFRLILQNLQYTQL